MAFFFQIEALLSLKNAWLPIIFIFAPVRVELSRLDTRGSMCKIEDTADKFFIFVGSKWVPSLASGFRRILAREFTDKVDLKFQVLVKMLAFWDLSDFGAEKWNLSMESSIIP